MKVWCPKIQIEGQLWSGNCGSEACENLAHVPGGKGADEIGILGYIWEHNGNECEPPPGGEEVTGYIIDGLGRVPNLRWHLDRFHGRKDFQAWALKASQEHEALSAAPDASASSAANRSPPERSADTPPPVKKRRRGNQHLT